MNRKQAAAKIGAVAADLGGLSEKLAAIAKDLGAEEPPPPPPPEEKGELFGIDVSQHQKDMDLKKAESAGAAFCMVRITGGLGSPRTHNVWVDEQASRNLAKVNDTGMVAGVYAYPLKPVHASIPIQVDVFLRNCGNLEGKLIGIDYEVYGPSPNLTPTAQNVRDFCHELQRRIGKRHLFLYAGKSFWEEDKPGWPHSGRAADYGAPGSIHLWAPWWPGNNSEANPIRQWKKLYESNKDDPDFGWFEPFGGQTPKMAQICIGIVDGRPCDINVFRGSREDLEKLTGLAPKVEPEDPDEPDEEGLPAWITKPRDYLLQCPGGPYVTWMGGRFTNRAPAWVIERGQQIPAPASVRQQGGFCVAPHNLAQAVNGIHPPDDVDSRPAWYGGVLWLGEIYQRERQVARRPLEDPADYPPMAAFVKNYQCGPFDATCPLPAQGHFFVKLKPGVAFNFDKQLGGNIMRDVPESIALTRGIDFWVHPNDWLRPPDGRKI